MICFIKESSLVLIETYITVIVLSSISEYNAQQVSSWNWTHPVSQTTMNANGSRVTVDYIKFKQCPYIYGSRNKFFYKPHTTKLECGIFCMEHPKCLTWIFYYSYGQCSLYDHRFQAYPLQATIYSKSSTATYCYEVQVIVTFHSISVLWG